MSTQNIKTPRHAEPPLALARCGCWAPSSRSASATRIYWAQVLRYHQTTDDAYVSGNVVQITPQISGTVVGHRRR